MSKVFEFLKPYAHLLALAFALLVVEALCALALPGHMADIVNYGVMTGNITFIWRTGIVMLLITLLSVVAALSMSYLSAKISTGVANDMRSAVFKKVLGFSNAEINNFAASSLITRTTNDITQIQGTMMMATRLLVYAPILGIGGIIRALNRDVSMSWVIFLASICMVGMMSVLFVVAMPKYRLMQTLVDRLNLVSRENLSGILIVRAFSTQVFEKKRFEKANRDLTDTSLFVDQAFAFFGPSIMLIMNLATAFIVWLGAHHASAFRIDIGDIFAFLQYGILIIVAFLMIGIMFVYLPRAVVCANRVQEVLETRSSLRWKENPLPLPKDFKGVVEFRDVNFKYPDASQEEDAVLTGISFTARPGQTTAIIGATGSGKSTLFKLLLRFYDVTGGGIYLDGMDIRDIHKEELHGKIGYAPQKALLFSGSIKSNLLYADKTAGDQRIATAAEIAQAASFIADKEGGYSANVAQGGANLSGGQRQRLSIARALVKNAQIYLFDDSFSALDLKTDALLRAALKKKMGGCTVLVIAQRVSSIMDADQIIVLDQGGIAGKGSHFELMGTCAVYREIAASQLSEEELKA
ncbi:MAG: ABC transporter ATP-binding protein/permease [Spirochaetes bacterium]|nr:ABC transporter ATP-binding protein/permease [Spirochaetota bacterium]